MLAIFFKTNKCINFKEKKLTIQVIFNILIFVIICFSLCFVFNKILIGQTSNDYVSGQQQNAYSGHIADETKSSSNIVMIIGVLGAIILTTGVCYFIFGGVRDKNACPRCKSKNDFIPIMDKEIARDMHKETHLRSHKIKDTNGKLVNTTKSNEQVLVTTVTYAQDRKCKRCSCVWNITYKKRFEK